ncbi:MAG: lytic transglycosylase domain-containing protein, partial [Oxalobacteraceae bacterium]
MRGRNFLILHCSTALTWLFIQPTHADVVWVGPQLHQPDSSGTVPRKIGGAVIFDMPDGKRGWTALGSAASARSASAVVGSSAMDEIALSAAQSAGVDPHLVKAVAWAESAFRADAVSHKGAIGVMQLMPSTASQYGVDDPYNAAQSLRGGARLLRDLLQRYSGEVPLALAAYNAGPGAVDRAGRSVPNYPETRAYIGRVLGAYDQLRGAATPAQAPALASGQGVDLFLCPASAPGCNTRSVGNARLV